MGKTKIKTIDDSAPTEEKSKDAPKPKTARPAGGTSKKEEDSLIAKLNAELGIEEKEEVKKPEVESTVEAAEETLKKTDEKVEAPKEEQSKAKKIQKPGKAKPRSKKYQELVKDLDRNQTYPIPEAVELTKKLSYSKFDGTLEVHINTAQTGIHGLVSLPFASGKKLKILTFGKGINKEDDVIVGDDTTIDEISKSKLDFDLVITTPEWMPKLAKIARVLGPKGLMPNPKNGTITDNLKAAVESFQAGKTEYKTEPKAPVIHLGIGKVSQPTEELVQNAKTLLSTLGKSRIKKVTLTPTMGPSVKVDISSL